jgi:hypothetical protein
MEVQAKAAPAGSPGVDTGLSTRGQKIIPLIQKDYQILVNPI